MADDHEQIYKDFKDAVNMAPAELQKFLDSNDSKRVGWKGEDGEGEEIAASRISQDDDIAQFISKVERTDSAFQRALSRAKVKQLVNFYETAVTQPPIPGTVLLFTSETLRYQSAADGMGHLSEPGSKFLIIDGQHRLAAQIGRAHV